MEDALRTGSLFLRFTIIDKSVVSPDNTYITIVGDQLTGGNLKGFAIAIWKPGNGLVIINSNDAGSYYRFDAPLPDFQVGISYTLAIVKAGKIYRPYFKAVPIINLTTTFDVGSLNGFSTTQPITFGVGGLSDSSTLQKQVVILEEVIAFSGIEIDRKDGAEYFDDIQSMEELGNFVPPRLHPYVIAHYPMQETTPASQSEKVSVVPSAYQMSLWGLNTKPAFTFVQDADGMKVINTGTIAANTMSSGSWYKYNLPENQGKWILEVDVEKTSTNPYDSIGFFFNYYEGGPGVSKSTTGRETLKSSFDSALNTQFFCEFSMWATSGSEDRIPDNLGFKIYSIILYRASDLLPSNSGLFCHDAVEQYNYAKTRSPEIIADPYFKNENLTNWTKTEPPGNSVNFLPEGGVRLVGDVGSSLEYHIYPEADIDLHNGGSFEATIDAVYEASPYGVSQGIFTWYDGNVTSMLSYFYQGKTTIRIDNGIAHRFSIRNNTGGSLLVKSFSLKQIQGTVQMGSDGEQYGGWNVVASNKGLGPFYWQTWEVGATAEKVFPIFAPAIIRLGNYRINEGITWKLELFNDTTGELASTQTFTETASGFAEGKVFDLKVNTGKWRVKITILDFTMSGTSGFDPWFLHRSDEIIPVGYKANPIHLLGYQGSSDILAHRLASDSGSSWSYDAATDTLTQAAMSTGSGSEYGHFELTEQLVDDELYCLSFICTQRDNAPVLFLKAGGSYNETAGVVLGENKCYFLGRSHWQNPQRIAFMNNSTPTLGFSAHSFKLEKTAQTNRCDIYSKKLVYPKVKFKDPAKYIEYPSNITSWINPVNANNLTHIFEFSAAKVGQLTWLYVNNALGICLVDLSTIGYSGLANDMAIVARIYNSQIGPTSMAIANLGVGTSIGNTRLIVTWDNTGGQKALKVAVNGKVLATSIDSNNTTLQDFSIVAYLFQVGTGSEVEGAAFQVFNRVFTDAEIALWGTYGAVITDSNLIEYGQFTHLIASKFSGTLVETGYLAITANYKGFTQEELRNAVVEPDGYLPVVRNGYKFRAGSNGSSAWNGGDTQAVAPPTFDVSRGYSIMASFIWHSGNAMPSSTLLKMWVYADGTIDLQPHDANSNQHITGTEKVVAGQITTIIGTVSATGQKELYLDGRKITAANLGLAGMNPFFTGWNFADIAGVGQSSNITFIAHGLWERPLEHREVAELHANGEIKPPTVAIQNRLYGYWNANQLGTYGSYRVFQSLAGRSGMNFALVGATADELNPSHADYAVYSLDELRKVPGTELTHVTGKHTVVDFGSISSFAQLNQTIPNKVDVLRDLSSNGRLAISSSDQGGQYATHPDVAGMVVTSKGSVTMWYSFNGIPADWMMLYDGRPMSLYIVFAVQEVVANYDTSIIYTSTGGIQTGFYLGSPYSDRTRLYGFLRAWNGAGGVDNPSSAGTDFVEAGYSFPGVLTPGKMCKFEIFSRGKNYVGADDLEILIDNVKKTGWETSPFTNLIGVPSIVPNVYGPVKTMQIASAQQVNTDFAFLALIDHTGKTDAQIAKDRAAVDALIYSRIKK